MMYVVRKSRLPTSVRRRRALLRIVGRLSDQLTQRLEDDFLPSLPCQLISRHLVDNSKYTVVHLQCAML